MNELTIIYAAYAPLRGIRFVPAVMPFRALSGRRAPDKQAGFRRALQCGGTIDRGTGRLICFWSESVPAPDQSSCRHGRRRAGAAAHMAA